MRQIGEIDNEADAKRFSNYLNANEITHDLQDEDTGSWLIWVHDEDLLANAETHTLTSDAVGTAMQPFSVTQTGTLCS